MTVRSKTHESMVPFENLAVEVRREDEPFAEAIRRVAAAQTGRAES